MSPTDQEAIQLLGPIFNFVQEAGPDPIDQSHQEGLTFVAMDAGAWPQFRGATLTGDWVVARQVNGDIPALNGWPKTGWRFQDESKAREAYQAMRAHIVAKLPGVEAAEDRGPERRLNDPARALGEAFSIDGEEAVYLSCDRGTEARILAMLTDRLEAYSTQSATPQRFASYSSQISPHIVGVGVGESGTAEHVVAAFTPGEEMPLVAQGLPRSVREGDLKPFNLEVPSGILVLAWGRLDGKAVLGEFGSQEPAMFIDKLLGESGATTLETPLDASAPGPLAWAIRVKPGTYACALRWLETEQGISAMALSHLEAKPLWADQIPRRAPAVQAPKPIAAPTAATIQAAQAAQAAMASGGGGDPDPLVFPGAKVAKLSDYVAVMKGMQRGDMMGALSRAGLDMMSYSQVAMAWSQKMATDPTLAAKFAAMMAKA